MFNYKDSKEHLLYIMPKKNIMDLILIVLIFILVIYCSLFKCYDIVYAKGIIRNNELYIISEPSLTNKILKTDFLTINEKKYSFIVKDVSEIMYNEFLNNYQEIKLNSKFKNNNLIVDIKLYQNKEIIIKKIYKMIF